MDVVTEMQLRWPQTLLFSQCDVYNQTFLQELTEIELIILAMYVYFCSEPSGNWKAYILNFYPM